jgi:mannan endo-1,4-beta-mannosidase
MCLRTLLLIMGVTLLFQPSRLQAQSSRYVTCSHQQFIVNNKPWYFIGANYWYGGLLANDLKGRERVKKELDFLKKRGVTNLRVMAAVEGEGQIHGVTRAEPAYQPAKNVYRQDLLAGLDFLLAEMNRRGMKAVIFLSNNWEWSGGFLQYLNWNGLISDTTLRRKLNWDEMRDYVSRFYSCEPCKEDYFKQVHSIVVRKNTITGKTYSNDPAIMAWELANEPRPMRPAANAAYAKWVSDAAAYIKSLDKNHLVTTGCEGEMGTENMTLFESIHADKNIDYATIHIWPKNWSWFKDTAIGQAMPKVISNTTSYITKHIAVTTKLDKPLVVEEFGLPRDFHAFQEKTPTTFRDQYYTSVFNALMKGVETKQGIAGANFWAFSGKGRPSLNHAMWWKRGDDLLGDPPMEEQGLNSVFDNDISTWNIIDSFIRRINK